MTQHPTTAESPGHDEATRHSEALFGVVLVTYHSAGVIRDCLQALADYPCEVVVVDNASRDKTVEIAREFPVRVIANSENRGFAAAVNQGFGALHLQKILVLNPDVRVHGTWSAVLDGLDDEGVAVTTAILTDEGGEPTHHFQFRRFPTPVTLLFENLGLNRLWPRNPVNQRYRYQDERWEGVRDVEQPAGAFLLIRRKVWLELGGFDEGFHPLWFEDVDFCNRVIHAGWHIRFYPIEVGTHIGGHSIEELEPGVRQLYWYRSLLRYASTHFSVVWVRILALSVLVALAGKIVTMTINASLSGTIKTSPSDNPSRKGRLSQFMPAARLALGAFIHGRPSSGSKMSA